MKSVLRLGNSWQRFTSSSYLGLLDLGHSVMDGYVAIVARGNRFALLRVRVVTGTALHAFALAVGPV